MPQCVNLCYNAVRHKKIMSPSPLVPAETWALRDGTAVELRALGLADQALIKAFFYRLSPKSVFYRLLEYRTTITEEEARQLCDMDGQDRMALAALHPAAGLIAVARYSVIPDSRPLTAENAIVVEDAYQRQGLGTELLRRLSAYARAHGVQRFTATVHANNTQILRFIEKSQLPARRRLERGVWEYVIDLAPEETPAAGRL